LKSLVERERAAAGGAACAELVAPLRSSGNSSQAVASATDQLLLH